MAQTEKGNVLIGGTAGFDYSKEGELKTTTFSLAPMAGFFVVDNLAVGGGVGLALTSTKFDGEDFNSTAIALQPMVRYYFGGSGNTRPFGAADFRWASVKVGDNDSESGVGFGIGVGIDFFLNSRVAIEGIVGYNSFKFSESDDATGTIGINFGVVAFIGGGSD